MRKQEFLFRLKRRLKGLSKSEAEERLSFYSEMIDDCVEEGYTEDEAVAKIGSVDDISRQIIDESHIVNPKRKRKTWESVLFWIGSPLWISIVAAAFSVAVALYVSLFATVVCAWAVFVSFAACGVAGTVAAIPYAIFANAPAGFALFGAGVVCAGLAILSFYGCRELTKVAFSLTKGLTRCIIKCFKKKEKIQ